MWDLSVMNFRVTKTMEEQTDGSTRTFWRATATTPLWLHRIPKTGLSHGPSQSGSGASLCHRSPKEDGAHWGSGRLHLAGFGLGERSRL